MKTLMLFLFCYLRGFLLCAQVAVNTDGSAPDPSAMLDIQSSTGGIEKQRKIIEKLQAEVRALLDEK